MRATFTRLRFGLMVGVGGGAPTADNDVRLGDLVVSQPTGVSNGVVQYDFGKAMENGEFLRVGSLNAPPSILLSAVASIKAINQVELGKKISDTAQEIEEKQMRFDYPGQDSDRLFSADYNHVAGKGRESETCKSCDTSKTPYSALIAAIYAKEVLLQIPSFGERDFAEREKIKKLNFTVPFRLPILRNRNFVGRAEELRKIYKYFADARPTDANEPRMYALSGTGGMGKTQIAIEHAYRHHSDYTAVFWVSAASEDTIRASFIDIMQCIVKEQGRITWPESTPDYDAIGSKLGIPGLIDSKGTVSADSETVGYIQSALLRWLELPGNVKWLLIFDNADDLETFDIQRYFPNQGGFIFITSRRTEFSQSAEQSDLEGLDKESAVKLLLSLASLQDISKSEVIALVEKLGFMPLAISHAGSYIREAKIPLEEYNSYYDKSFMTVQSKKPRFGWNYRNDTAATTWEISFSRVENQDKEAAALLLVCSYLNPEEIFEDLWEDGQVDKLEIFDHLGKYKEAMQWYERAFAGREKSLGADHLLTLSTLNNIAAVFSSRGKYSDALPRYERALAGYEKALGVDHPSTLNIIHNIAVIFSNQGKYNEAIQWYGRALTGYEKTLGTNHPLTLSTVNNIAAVFQKQGKYDNAMQWFERALAGREKELGVDHPSTLSTINNIGVVLFSQDKWDEAMQRYEQALIGYEEALGADHPMTLSIVNNIAAVLENQGKYRDSLQRYEQALIGYEKVFGADHPSTLSVVNNIGLVFSKVGKYDNAIQWYAQALAGREKVLGAEHPSTLSTVHNVGTVFDRQNKYDDAKQWYERALAGREKVLGVNHPSTLHTAEQLRIVIARKTESNSGEELH
ncbi:Nephrocystin-3 [Dactylellina cionopaga]|nr:Nephrocystin-3 [Dactylellina cionopaga]